MPNIDVAAGLNAQQVQANGQSVVALYGVNFAAFGRVWQLDWVNGDNVLTSQLTAASTLVEEQTAASLGVGVGDRIHRVATVKGARPGSRCSACTATRRCSTDSS